MLHHLYSWLWYKLILNAVGAWYLVREQVPLLLLLLLLLLLFLPLLLLLLLFLLLLLLLLLPQVWDRHRPPPPLPDQQGRLVVMTGGGRGIGHRAVLKLVENSSQRTLRDRSNPGVSWMSRGAGCQEPTVCQGEVLGPR